MNFQSIISLEYIRLTDRFNLLINKSENKSYNIEIKSNDNNNNKNLIVYSEDQKILVGKYELLGNYDISCNLFSWACNYILVDKTSVRLCKEIRKYAKTLKKMISMNEY